jgi:hypothetical protein
MAYPDPPSPAKRVKKGLGRDFLCLSLSYFSLDLLLAMHNIVHDKDDI